MLDVQKDYRTLLRQELTRRCDSNPRYSLRAFARDLKMAPARVSEILNYKQGLSRAAAWELGQTLGYDERDREIFCDLVESVHARSRARRELAKSRLVRHQLEADYFSLGADAFKTLADWYHLGVWQLTRVDGFREDYAWIGKRLGIKPAEAESAIKRLLELKILARDALGQLKPVNDFLGTESDTDDQVLNTFHAQILKKALAALHSQASAARGSSSTIMAIDESLMPEAKRKLRVFRRKFDRWLHANSKNKTKVYSLSIHFFDVSDGSAGGISHL